MEQLRHDPSLLHSYVQEDLQVIHDISGWRTKKRRTKDGLESFVRDSPNSKKVKLFLVRSHVSCSVEDLWDILRTHLVERQREWHFLFVDGYQLEEELQEDIGLYYMSYKGPNVLVKTRDFLYMVVPHQLEGGGFLLTYRSVEYPDVVPLRKGRIRGEIVRAAHMVVPEEDGSGCMLYSLQQADARG